MSDTPPIMALDLPMLDPLPKEIQKYFDICQEKLGMVPNVLPVSYTHLTLPTICSV